MGKKLGRKPDNSSVYRYKHFYELRDCLRSGWSASKIRDYLEEKYGPEGLPGEKAIER